jgi:probable HAF family extracellular repeat protein
MNPHAHTRTFALGAGLALTAGLALAAAALADQPRYTMADLGTLGGPWSNGLGINNLGHVVGQADMTSGGTGPFVHRDGQTTLVPGLHPSNGGAARAINDRGEIVGYSMTPTLFFPGLVGHAFYFSPATGPVDLTPGTDNASVAFAINNVGQIVGERGANAYLWTVSPAGEVTTTLLVIPGHPAGFGSTAWGINDAGIIVGGSWVADPAFRFAGWARDATGQVSFLPSLGGRDSQAYFINASGLVVGQSQINSGLWHPTMWLPVPDTTPTAYVPVDLGTLPPPYDSGDANFINSAGVVVGFDYSVGEFGVPARAWIWREGVKQALVDLLSPEDQLRWELTTALAINDAGQITGIGIYTPPGGEPTTRAFLMAPVVSTPCLADVTGIGGPPARPDGLVTGDDFNAFIAAFASEDPLADLTGIGGPPAIADGLITGDDFNAFIAAFAAGCP